MLGTVEEYHKVYEGETKLSRGGQKAEETREL